jgi:hypothetical protein
MPVAVHLNRWYFMAGVAVTGISVLAAGILSCIRICAVSTVAGTCAHRPWLQMSSSPGAKINFFMHFSLYKQM